jgi:hypothetical protein
MQEINESNKSFGDETRFLLKNLETTRQAIIIIEKVLFEDKSVWTKGENKLYKNVDIELISDSDELNSLRSDIGNDAVCYAKELGEAWLCICGRQNLNTQSACQRCKREKEKVFSRKISRESILEKIADNNRLLEQRRIEVENTRFENANKIKARITIIAAIAVLVAAIVGVTVQLKQYADAKINTAKAQELAVEKHNEAKILSAEGKNFEAMIIYRDTAGNNDGRKKYNLALEKMRKITAGDSWSLGLKSDGTVVAAGDNQAGQCSVSGWKDIVAISAGAEHSLGLKSDNSVIVVGDYGNGSQRNYTTLWRNNIVAISAGSNYSLGLKSDGTVIAAGNNNSYQSNIRSWKLN